MATEEGAVENTMATETEKPKREKAAPTGDGITVAEAAALLGVHAQTIRTWIREGKLPATWITKRTVRINRADVLALVPPGGGSTPKGGAT